MEQTNFQSYPPRPILSLNETLLLTLSIGDHLASNLATLDGQYYASWLNELEPLLLAATMRLFKGNQSQCARFLGINRGTFRRKLKQHNLLEDRRRRYQKA